jgi:acyl-CoA reductase-like NAD-dependent aldehyde dehydrogenase
MDVQFEIQSPMDGRVHHRGLYLSEEHASERLLRAEQAQKQARSVSVAERAEWCKRALNAYEAKLEQNSRAISELMGKPLGQARGEFGGMKVRTLATAELAPRVLAEERLTAEPGFSRSLAREPIGLVLDIAAWNYPLLVATNVIMPGVMAGNAVLIKHAPQTALVGRMFEDAFRDSGAPEGLVQDFMLTHDAIARVLQSGRIGHVAFTGSVAGGRKVQSVVAGAGLVSAGFELGGKDAALVLEDADVEHAAINIADGAFYNAGQSCCAVERVYVPRPLYRDFVALVVAEAKKLKLGHPLEDGVSLGPVVNEAARERIDAHTADALSRGAEQLTKDTDFDVPGLSRCYVAPRVLVGVDHSMLLMTEETFGPVIGIMAYDTEAEGTRLANDSRYGLTASIWTRDAERAHRIGQQLKVGTVLMNRCDYVDPGLPWTGVGDSGLGSTLGADGLCALTRPRGYHFRLL